MKIMVKRNLRLASLMFLLLIIISITILVITTGFGIFLFKFSEKAFWPESYWSKEVVKLEHRIKIGNEKHSKCTLKLLEGKYKNIDFYNNMINQGADHKFASGVATAVLKRLEKDCNRLIDEQIIRVVELSDAKAELEKSLK